MGKKLRIRDQILITAAILGDAFFDLTESPYFKVRQLKRLLTPGFSSTSFTCAVYRMLKTGEIEKVIKNGEPCLRLTGTGKGRLVRDFPILKLRSKKWDGLWRIVFYDIEEKRKNTRQALQWQLESLGFGRLQKSVYLSPLPISEDLQEFIESRGLKDLVFVGVCKKLLAGEEKELAVRVWQLEKLYDRYDELRDDIDEYLAGEGKMNFNQLYTKFEGILLDDPLLPKELLPDWWNGNKVIATMKKFLKVAERGLRQGNRR